MNRKESEFGSGSERTLLARLRHCKSQGLQKESILVHGSRIALNKSRKWGKDKRWDVESWNKERVNKPDQGIGSVCWR